MLEHKHSVLLNHVMVSVYVNFDNFGLTDNILIVNPKQKFSIEIYSTTIKATVCKPSIPYIILKRIYSQNVSDSFVAVF